MSKSAREKAAGLQQFPVELEIELADWSEDEVGRLGIAQGAAEHLLETFNDDGSVQSAQGICIDRRAIVRVSFAADDEAEALEFARNAAEHLMETFNDDESLEAVHFLSSSTGARSASAPSKGIVRTTIEIEVSADGSALGEVAQAINTKLTEFLDDNPLAGGCAAVLGGRDITTRALGPSAASLDEEEVATFLSSLIESGNMRLEDLPKLMARYALSDPVDMREEFAERMGLEGDAQNEGAHAMRPRG